MSAILHGPALCYATRATGPVTMLLLTACVLLGVLTTGRFAGGSWPRFLTVGLHRNLSLLVLVFPALHVGNAPPRRPEGSGGQVHRSRSTTTIAGRATEAAKNPRADPTAQPTH